MPGELPIEICLCGAGHFQELASIGCGVGGARTSEHHHEEELYRKQPSHTFAIFRQYRMDQKLLFLINREWTSPVLDWLMAVLSSAALWGVPLAVLCALLVIRGGFRGRVYVGLALIAFLFSDGIVGRAVKYAAGRFRPHQSEAGVRTVDLEAPAVLGMFRPLKVKISTGTGQFEEGAEGRSFPSNHASNTMAAATVAMLIWRRRGWLAVIPAIWVAYSRIYVGAHWPSDVLAGMCLGAGVAIFVFALAEIGWRRFAQRFAWRHPSLLSA